MFFEQVKDGTILRVRLSPNSSCCKINGIFNSPNGDYLKINITSVPQKGQANAELIQFLSKLLHIGKSNFTIIAGELDRYKKILITGEQQAIIAKLQTLTPKENS